MSSFDAGDGTGAGEAMGDSAADPHPCIGVVRRCEGRGMVDLYFYDDGIVVAKSSNRDFLVHVAGLSVGRGAMRLVNDYIGTQGEAAKRARSERDDLLALHETNYFLRYDDLASAVLKKGFFGNPNLKLTLRDGAAHRFAWKGTMNDPAATDPLLRHCIPNLIEG
jgi:hypothetical protein